MSIVDKYVITVAEDRGSAGGQALTTIRVDLSEERARVTELTVRPTEAISVDVATHLPIIDVLLRALSQKESAQASLVSTDAETVAAELPGERVASRVQGAG